MILVVRNKGLLKRYSPSEMFWSEGIETFLA